MTWNNQAESMMKMWTEAQRTMMQNWYDAVQTTSTPAMFNPALLEEWRKLAAQGMEMWTGNADPVMRNVSSQMLASQTAMMQLLEFTTKAWQSMAPKLDAGQDWSSVMSSYVEQMRQQMMPDAKGWMQSAQDSSQLLQMYMNQMNAVGQPWMNVMQQAPGLMTGSMVNNNPGEMIELTRLTWDAFNETFGKMTMSPSFGLTRELEEKVARAFDAYQDLQQSSNDYQVMMADAWAGVFEQVLQEMKNRADQGKPVESLRDMFRLWMSAADQSFDKVFRTDTYADVQGRFVSNFMKYRIEEQKVTEELLKYTYIPSRGEMDEAHKNIYELRKEVKALKKALNQKSSPSRSRSKKAETSQE